MNYKEISRKSALQALKQTAITKIKEAIEFAKTKDSRRFEFERWFNPRRYLLDNCEETNSLMRIYIHYGASKF